MGVSALPGNTMYEAFVGSTTHLPGSAGLVPAPPSGAQDLVLYGDGNWGSLPDYTDRFKNLEQSISKIHTYKHPTHDTHTMGFYKLAVDSYGHVSKVDNVTKADLDKIGIPTKITDNLNSTDSKAILSANQGRILDQKKLNKSGGELTDTLYTRDIIPKIDDERDLGERSMRYRKLFLSDGIENLTRETTLVPATGTKFSTKQRSLIMNKQHRKDINAYRDEIVIGRYPHGSENKSENNVPASYCDDNIKAAFVVGNGTPKGDSDAIRVMYDGRTISDQFHAANGSAYSQYLEWSDGNPTEEDRIGLFVTFDGDKIVKANTGDYITGVVCETSAVVGNADIYWSGQFQTDGYGRPIYENVNQIDEDTGKTVICKRRMVSETFDIDREYIPRVKRPEWSTVAMVGMVRVHDDGSCVVGGFCKAGENGLGTAWVESDGTPITVPAYKVTRRIASRIVEIQLK